MGDCRDYDAMAGNLRERHIGQSAASQATGASTRDRMDGQAYRNIEKEKKTFGRTPDGTGKIQNLKGRRYRSVG